MDERESQERFFSRRGNGEDVGPFGGEKKGGKMPTVTKVRAEKLGENGGGGGQQANSFEPEKG